MYLGMTKLKPNGQNICAAGYDIIPSSDQNVLFSWLLSKHIDQLKQQLDSVRTVQETGCVIDRNFREVVSPLVQAGGQVMARRGRQGAGISCS